MAAAAVLETLRCLEAEGHDRVPKRRKTQCNGAPDSEGASRYDDHAREVHGVAL
jgi:hypothetical protein